MGADQKIAALDLAKGRARWITEDRGFPLGFQDGKLYVLKQDQVLGLDPLKGKVVMESQTLGLGGWSILGSNHSHGGQRFSHREVFTSEHLLMEWSAVNERVTGFAGVIKEGEGGGLVRINLDSGAVSKLDKMPPAGTGKKEEPKFLGPMREALPKGDSLISMFGLDGGFILVRPSLAHESVDWYQAAKLWFRWDLYELASEKKLASPKIPLLVREFSVVRDRLLGLWQDARSDGGYDRELWALDFRGKRVWTLSLWSPPSYPPVP